jgi:hypothetical protein
MSNGAHAYHGVTMGRAARLASKMGETITLQRLDALLGGSTRPPIAEALRNPKPGTQWKKGARTSHEPDHSTRRRTL